VSPRITVALAAALVLVVGYIALVDRPQARRAEQAAHLVQLAKSEITSITLQSPKGTVELMRRDATHWEVTQPIHAPAVSFVVGDLLDNVTGLVSQRALGKDDGDPAAYGLGTPTARITLGTAKGGSVTLEVGNPTPVGAALYARVLPGSSVYLVDSSVKGLLSKSATDLRQKSLADFANADVQHIRILSPKGTLDVARLGSDRWRLEGVHPWPADDFKVTDLFFALTSTDAKVFHDGVGDLTPYHLDSPAVTVEIKLRGQAGLLRVLLVQQGKVAYATVGGSGIVLEMDPSILGKLEPDPLSLVSRRILPYNPQDLTGVTWRRGGQTLAVLRQGPGFTGGGLRENEISEMFSSISLLDGEKLQPLPAPPAGQPAFDIRTDGAPDARFLVKFFRDSTGGWIAASEGVGLEYHLAANAFDGLPRPIKAFLGLEQPAPPAAPAAPAPKK
jgi:hypothetical protein